jgi:hypothetical protein
VDGAAGGHWPLLVLDATGVGGAVVEMVARAMTEAAAEGS